MDSILEVLIIAIICLLLQKVNKSNEISKDTLSVVTFDKKNQKDGMLLSRNNSQIKEKPDQELIEQKNVEPSKNNCESNLKSKSEPTTMVIDPYDHHFLAHKHSESSLSTNSSGYEDFFDAQQGSSPVSTTKAIENLDSIKGGNPVPTTTARINKTTSLPDGVSGVPFVSGRNMDESKNKKTTDSAKTVSYATNPDAVNGNSQYLASNQKNTIDSSKESRRELCRNNSLNSSKPVTYYRHRTENSLPYQYAQHQYPFQQHPPENTTHLEITQASQIPSAQFQPVYPNKKSNNATTAKIQEDNNKSNRKAYYNYANSPFDLPINITTSKPDTPTSTTNVPKSIASSFKLARDLSSIEGSVHSSGEEEETKEQSYQERKVQQEGEKNQELNRNTKETKPCSVLNNGNSEDNRGIYKTSMLGRSVSLSSANPSKPQKKKYSNITKSPPILGKADVKAKNDDSDNYMNIDKSPVYYNSGLETATLISEDGPILISDGFSILSLPSNNNKGQRSETVKPKRPKHKRGLSEGSIMAKYLDVEATSSSASSSSGIHKTLKLTDDQSNSDYNSSVQLDQQLNIKKRHQRKNLIEKDKTMFTCESEKSVANGDFESSAGKGVNQYDKNRNNIKFMEETNDNIKSAPPQSHHHPTTNSTYIINNNNINTKSIDNNNNTNYNHHNNNDTTNNPDHEVLFQKLHSKKPYELKSTSDQLLPPPTKSDHINRYIEYSNFPSPLEAIAAQAIKEQNKLMARGNKSSSSSRKSDKNAESASKQPQKSRSRGLPNEYQGIGEDEFPTLSANGLYAFDVMGDGNCLFRALSDQYFGDGGKHHMKIRQMTVDYMAEHADDFRMFITDETWEQHLKRMKKDGVFGDQAEIVSFSRCANVDISIHQRDTEPLLIRPNGGDKDTRRSGEKNVRPTLHIAYHYWEHYSSVRRVDGPYTGPPQINLRFRSGGIPDNSTEVYATKNAQRRRNREHECVQMILGSLHYTVSEEVVRNELKRFGGNGDSALEYMLTHQDQFDEELIKERKIKEQQLIQLQKQQQLQEKEEERRRRRRSSKNTTTTSSSDHYSSSSSKHYHNSAASNDLATGSVALLPPGYSNHGGAMTGGLDVLDGHQKDMDLNKPLPPLPKHRSASSRHPTSSYSGSGGVDNTHENNVSIPPRSSSLPQHKAHTASISTTSSSGNNSSRHSRTHSASIVTPATSSSSTSSSHGSHRHYRSHSSVSSSGVAGAPTVVDPSVIAAYKSSSQSHHPSSLHSHQHGLVAPTVPVSSSSSFSSHSHHSSGATPLSGDNVKLTSSSSTRDPSSSHGTKVSTSGNSSSSTATDKPTRPKKLTAREKKDRQKYEASQRRKAKRLAEAAAAAGGNGGSTGRDNEDDGAISIRAIAI